MIPAKKILVVVKLTVVAHPARNVSADNDVWDFGPVDNQREHCMRSIVVSKSSPAHAADAVSDQRCEPPLWPLWEQTIHQKCF